MHDGASPAPDPPTALRRYLAVSATANLVWEFAQMPLYTLRQTGTTSEIVFAALHCTGGDVIIALSSLLAALLLTGWGRWPGEAHARVAALTLAFGLVYTAFSEWLNVEIRQSWAYRDIMPVLPVLGTGLSPLAQWIAVPLAALWWAQRPPHRPCSSPSAFTRSRSSRR